MDWFSMAAVSLIVTSACMVLHMILSHTERKS